MLETITCPGGHLTTWDPTLDTQECEHCQGRKLRRTEDGRAVDVNYYEIVTLEGGAWSNDTVGDANRFGSPEEAAETAEDLAAMFEAERSYGERTKYGVREIEDGEPLAVTVVVEVGYDED